ncbi:hypothetical protein, partial [Klebsiella aerogenes]|uniref:hypothetical protein n=1 Tax=Klebsiella aerogenes TaxID=548 RepID=UPI001952C11A
AAERTRRVCIGIEIEPTFVDLVIRRWQAETGKDAVRISDGILFSAAEKAAKAAWKGKGSSASQAPLLLEGKQMPHPPEAT